MPLRLVIFDLDGTLVDTIPDLTDAMNEALGDRAPRLLTCDEVKVMVGDGPRTTVQRALDLLGMGGDESPDAFLEQYIAGQSRVRASRLFPGAREALFSLKQSGLALALCTNKVRRATDEILAAFALDTVFDAVVAADEVDNRKPHPDHVRIILDRLGVPAVHALYVGDSVNDFLAARGAGVCSVAVAHGYGGGSADEWGADLAVEQLADLPALVRDLPVPTGQP